MLSMAFIDILLNLEFVSGVRYKIISLLIPQRKKQKRLSFLKSRFCIIFHHRLISLLLLDSTFS